MLWMKDSLYIPLGLFYEFDGVEFWYVIPKERHDAYDRVLNAYARELYGSEKAMDDPDIMIDVLNHARPTLYQTFYQEALQHRKEMKLHEL